MSAGGAHKVKECPRAFVPLAEKHNSLVSAVYGLKGSNGIKVVWSDRGGVIVGGAGTSDLAFAQVVTANGTLQNCVIVDNVANTYPTQLRVVTPNVNVVFDSVGALVETSGGSLVVTSTGFSMRTAGGKFCNIAFSAVTRDMAVRTITVCDTSTGTSKSMDILATAAY